jgi:uncharacterized protein YjiS (DUF1127 family)
MLKNLLPTSEVINDHVPVLSAPQSYARRMTYQRWLRAARYFLSCLDVARQRRQLLALDERKLKDVGISRIDALREANRQFWDLPEHLKPRR